MNYLRQFIPSTSDLTSNLRRLLKKDVLFQWTYSHEKEFQELKSKGSSDACLLYFDTTRPVTLQVDASKVGLIVVLIQKDIQGRSRWVAFASKSLTPAETRYANIECEMLALVFGCIRFHHYLYGREFICQSDHRPHEGYTWSILVMFHQGCKGYCLRYNRIILSSSMFKVKTSQWQMHSAESAQMRR